MQQPLSRLARLEQAVRGLGDPAHGNVKAMTDAQLERVLRRSLGIPPGEPLTIERLEQIAAKKEVAG